MIDEKRRKAADAQFKKEERATEGARPCPNTKPKVRRSAPRLRV